MESVKSLESLEIFTNISEDILTHLYTSKLPSNTILEPHIIQTAKEDMKKLITNSNFDANSISEQLQNKGWSEDKVSCLISLLEKRKSELLYATLLNHNSKHGDTVTDFDWLVKLVMGTNDLKTLSYPLLQLILSTINSKGDHHQKLFDINKNMLGKLINLLENVDDLQ